MKNILFTFISFLLFSSYITAEESPQDPSPKQDIAKLSESFGHLIGKNINSMGLQFDIASVIKGLQESSKGGTAPMTEMECIQAITQAQQLAFEKQSSSNLEQAEEFLKKNVSSKGVVSIENGKVQYKVDHEGQGGVLSESSSPLIRYVGKFLDGTVFGSSTEDEPLSLNEVIPGLKSALVGMKEGEKRTIYIHPEFAYGTSGALPPNSLLTFEIEIVKAEAPVIEETPSVTAHGEIAMPEGIEHLQ
jgi:peptidylprolyl isomerase